MRHRQRGMTLIGMLCVLALVGIVAYAGMRLIPVYLNYMKVARTMQQVAVEFKGESADPAKMRVALDRHWTIEDISQVEPKDVEFKKDSDGLTMHLAYEQSVPYVANISLTASFDKSVKVE